MGILLDSWYSSLVPRLLCTGVRERDYLVYTHAICIAESRTVLCGLTFVNYIILYFRPLWRCVGATGWYCSLWSTRRLSNMLSMQDFLLLVYTCMTSLSTNVYKTWYCCIKPWLYFEMQLMQWRIIDSVAPGYLWQNLQSRYFLTSHPWIWQETSNPVALRRLGTEKVAQLWCTGFRMRNYILRSKLTNGPVSSR